MIRERLFRNGSLKLFSLLLGVAVFFAVRSEQDLATTVALRLVLREPPSLINTADLPPEITVRISGRMQAIRTLSPGDIGPVTLDLSSFEKGEGMIHLRAEHLRLPPDVEVVSISPSSVRVQLETRERRRMPVEAKLEGKPAAGFVVSEVEVEPAEVLVEGARREIRELRKLTTAPVPLAGARADVTAEVAIDVPGKSTRLVEPVRASVRVDVEPERIDRRVKLRVADVPGRTGSYAVSATLRGPRDVLDSLDEASLQASAVDVPGAGKHSALPVRIDNLPDGVEVVEPLPKVRRPPPAPTARGR